MQVAFSAYAITGLFSSWLVLHERQLAAVRSSPHLHGDRSLLLAARLGAFRWNAADLI